MPPPTFPAWFERAFSRVDRLKHVTLAASLCLLVWGGATGGGFITNTVDVGTAAKGSRTERDVDELSRAFPGQAQAKALIVTVRSVLEGGQVACPKATCGVAPGAACRALDGHHEDLAKAWTNLAQGLLEYAQPQDAVSKYESYYSLAGTELDPIKCAYASSDGRLAFGSFIIPEYVDTHTRHHLIDKVRDLFKKVNPDPSKYEFATTGFDPLAYDGAEQAIHQVVKIDMVAMPVAFTLLGVMLKSWRLLCLCLLCTVITLATSFGLLNVLTHVTHSKPMSTTASLVESLAMAMSIDYGLFYGKRFRDELRNGRDVTDAVKLSLLHAGHVVCMSGLTFSLVFFGCAFLPSVDLRDIGVACMMTVLIALVVCTSVYPSMLLAFPGFFSAGHQPEPRPQETAPLLLGYTATGRHRHHRGKPYGGCYFRFLKLATRWPFNVLLVVAVYTLALPIALNVFRMEHNQNVLDAISRSASAAKAYRVLAKALPGGTLSPFTIAVRSPRTCVLPQNATTTKTPCSRKFFDFTHSVLTRVQEKARATPEWGVSSITYLQGEHVTFDRAMSLLNPRSPLCTVLGGKSMCAVYRHYWASAVSPVGDATLITVVLPDNPYAKHGQDFTVSMWELADAINSEQSDFHLSLTGDEVMMYSEMKLAFDALPALLIATVLTISTLLALGFKSVFVPIRLSLTVLMPLATVYGLGVLVYQDGMLDFLGVAALEKKSGGFYWFVPFVTLLQNIGLVCDYDVFAASRILEHRSDGYDMQTSIIKSVWEVQNTIIAAGGIMIGVFSGMLLGDSDAVNQFGFLLVMSCFLDTFVVQTLLVPPIMSMGGSFTWWPRPLPTEGLITLADAEFEEKE